VADRAGSEILWNLGKTMRWKIRRDDALYMRLEARDQREVVGAGGAEAVQDHDGRKLAATGNIDQMDATHFGVNPPTPMAAHSDHRSGQTIAEVTQTPFSSDAPKAYDRSGGMGIVKGGEAKPAASKLLRWLFPNGTGSFGGSAADFDPGAVEQTLSRVGRLFGERSYFPLEIDGLHHLPDPPVLLVSNHSGGTTIPDVWGLVVAWYRHFGVERPIHPMAHEIILSIDATRRYFGARGVVDANRETALRVLADWKRDLLVMPGGDLDTWRPHKDRYKVRFGGRKGYARLALETGVPIVPIAHAGAHDTLFVVTDGRRLAERLRLPNLVRSSIFPIHFSLPWGLAIGPWPHIPVPAKLRYRIGRPIDPKGSSIEQIDAAVRTAIQEQLDSLAGT
jgi:1-acyl-sn-glycerol-3-phosphate acyltransferase